MKKQAVLKITVIWLTGAAIGWALSGYLWPWYYAQVHDFHIFRDRSGFPHYYGGAEYSKEVLELKAQLPHY